MAKQTVNIGASPNDGTGDPLRNAFDKVNDNFDEVYADSFVTEDRVASGAITINKINNSVKVIEAEGISSNDNDTTIPTSAAVKDYVDTEIASLIDSAPATLDTLNELAAALGDDANFASTVTASIATKAAQTDLDAHEADTLNPHSVTKAQVGLSNVDNTSDANKPVSTATQTALDGKQDTLTSGDVTLSLIDPAAIVTEAEGIASNDNDTTIPTSAAVVDYVATQAGSDTTYTISTATDTSTTQKITLTGSDSSTDDVILEAGGGINLANNAGNILITNSSQGSSLNLSAGTGISVTGSWPNLTVTNTATDQTLTLNAGTGMSVTGTYPNLTVTNSAPDQTVSLTQGGATTITGTYPNFTISSTDTNTFRTISAGGSTLGATESLSLVAGSNVSISESGGIVTISSTDTNTQLSTEQVQDIVGAMVSGNTETNITVTYDDATGKLNFVANEGDITGVSAGSGLSGGGTAGTVTISHADTSTAANLTASSRRYVTGLTFDTYGHVTGYSTGTETVVDTNTTYTNGTGLSLSGTTFSINYGSSGAWWSKGLYVQSNGVMEAGAYIDFHSSNTTTADYTARMQNTSGSTIHVSGAFTAASDITAYSSDERLKENIVPISNALEKLEAIKGVHYSWKDGVEELGFLPTAKNEVGVIAQDIEKVLPEIVKPAPFDLEDDGVTSKSGENYKTVQYDKLTALLIEAVKELSAEVKELKSKI